MAYPRHRVSKKPREKAIVPVLATPGDPLVLADGTIVYEEPEPGSIQEEAKNNKAVNPRTFRASKKRSVKELPGDITIIKAIGCVILLTVMGIGDREIADALNIEPADLKKVRMHSAYPECFNTMVGEFINANSELITARLAAYAGNAVDNIMNIAETGTKEETKLRANIDIADRAGVNPKEQAGRSGLHVSDLRIQIIKKEDSVDVNINGSAV